MHLEGRAVDVVASHDERRRLSDLAPKFGLNGIGLGETFIHLDDRESPATWTYS